MESLVESATSDVRMGLVDFGVNLEICDALGRNSDDAPVMVAAVRKRLASKDPHVLALSLTLLEMCVKNCGDGVHRAVGTPAFMDAVSKVAEKAAQPATRSQALALIQQWGRAFEAHRESLPCFSDAYTGLKVKGLPFPEEEGAPPVFTPPRADGGADAPSDDAAFAAALADGSHERNAALEKVAADLAVVAEKIRLCNEMVPNSPGVNADPALAAVVGFLEACRPRLAVLVEAGLTGVLGDETLTLCLKVNDDLHATLKAEASGTTYEAPSLPPAAPPTPPRSAPLLALDLDDDEDDGALARSQPPAYSAPVVPPAAAPPPPPAAADLLGGLAGLAAPPPPAAQPDIFAGMAQAAHPPPPPAAEPSLLDLDFTAAAPPPAAP